MEEYCYSLSCLISYLGLPLGHNLRSKVFGNPVVELFVENGFFFKGGKLTLVQAILSGIPVYFIYLFKKWKCDYCTTL